MRDARTNTEGLLVGSQAYAASRLALVEHVLVARSEGFSYADIARVAGLTEEHVRLLVRPMRSEATTA